MSGTTPPQGSPETPPGEAGAPSDETAPAAPPPKYPGDTVSFGGYGPAGPTPPGAIQHPPEPHGHMGKVIGIAAALTLIAGGGAFAFIEVDPLNLFESGPQAAEAVPGTALAYFGVDLDPSAVQKVNALRFLNHFPAFTDLEGIKDERSDVRKAIFDEALDSAGCASDLNFNDDVEPWLGYKFGFGLMPPRDDGGDPVPVFALEVTDSDQAADGLVALAECGDVGDSEFGYAGVGDYMLISETQELADDYADQAGDGSLADSDAFGADMDELGDLGVATAWVDITGVIEALPDEVSVDEFSPTSVPQLESLDYERAATTFRFSSDHVEWVTKVYGGPGEIDHGDNEVVGLPASTVFAMSEAGGGDRLATSWDDIKKVIEADGVDVDAELADFEAETGFTIPDDIETLLGDNLLLSVDADGLTADVFNEIEQSGDFGEVSVGVRFKGDRDKLEDLYGRIMDLIDGSFGPQLPFEKTEHDDGFVIATNDDYGNALADLDGDLGASDQFQSVIEDAADKEMVIYFDWDLVEDEIVDVAHQDGASDDDIANLTPLRAFGLSAEVEGDYTTYTFRMSVND